MNGFYRSNFCSALLALGLISAQADTLAQDRTCRVINNDLAGVYEGDCKSGLANGRGKATGNNSYKGFFLGGKPHGTGIYVYSATGSRHEGEFRDGQPNGRGILYFLNGDRVDGQFRGGQLQGDGILTKSNGQKLVVNTKDSTLAAVGGTESAAMSSEMPTRPLASAPSSALVWEPQFDFGDLFPSWIITTSTMKTSNAASPNYIGDPNGIVGIEIRNVSPNTKIHGVIEIDQIAERTEFSYVLPTAGQYKIYPKIKWNFQKLSNVRQPITVNASMSIAVGSAAPEIRTQSIRVRSINDAVLAYRFPDGRVANKMWALAGFVNENHPAIDSILREALNIPVPIVREFVGYQKGPQEVVNQVFAIWYLFQRNGFTYSSITTPTGASANVQSQYVRFFEDSLRTQQANCIDGTALFASVLRRIGIDPIIVLVPSHAYLGFWLDQQHREPAFLETTAMNTDANPYRNQKPSKFRDSMARMFKTDLKLQRAAETFNSALAMGQENFRKNHAGFKSRAGGFEMLEIDKMRKLGIQPINH